MRTRAPKNGAKLLLFFQLRKKNKQKKQINPNLPNLNYTYPNSIALLYFYSGSSKRLAVTEDKHLAVAEELMDFRRGVMGNGGNVLRILIAVLAHGVQYALGEGHMADISYLNKEIHFVAGVQTREGIGGFLTQ